MKTIFFSVLMALVTQFAWGQNHDAMAADQPEPVKLVKLFPNPATEYITVKFENPMARSVKLTLHNIIGNSLEIESEIMDEYEIRLKVKDLPTGYYLLAVKDSGNSQSSFKFLKR